MAVIFNDEQRKLIFEILPVDRIQDDEDPWWNVHIEKIGTRTPSARSFRATFTVERAT